MKFRTDLEFAFTLYSSSHLLDDLLADRESKARAAFIEPFVLFQLFEILEELFDSLWRDADSVVCDSNFKQNVFFVKFKLVFRFFARLYLLF